MKHNIIEVPDKFHHNCCQFFFQSLENVQTEEKVVIDFSKVSYSYPLGMLIIGSYLRQWLKVRKENKLKTLAQGIDESKDVHGYLMHLGFFQFVNLDVGNNIGEANGSDTYIPIREIERAELEKFARENDESLVDAIMFQSRSLACILGGCNENIQGINTYSYAIREILRNVFEHSGVDKCYLCGQRWRNGKSEIAIIDEGVGIYKTLKQVYNIHNAQEAIELAIQPGITRTSALSDEENIYDNSGYGLYVLSELGKSFGWFCLGSDSAKLTYTLQEKYTESFNFKGTFIGVHLDKIPYNFEGVLKDIISIGEEEALAQGRFSFASSMSRSLSCN